MGENITPAPEPTPAPEATSGYIVADPKRPYKAIAAFVITVLGLLWANLAGRDSLGDMTLMEWLTIIVPTILTTGAVYGVSNPITFKKDGQP